MQRNFYNRLKDLENLETNAFQAYKCLYICATLVDAPIPANFLSERFSNNTINHLALWLDLTEDQTHYILKPHHKKYLQSHFEYKNQIDPDNRLINIYREIVDSLIIYIEKVNIDEVLQKHVERMLALTDYRSEELTHLVLNSQEAAMKEQMGPCRETPLHEIHEELSKQSSVTDEQTREELNRFIAEEQQRQLVVESEKRIVRARGNGAMYTLFGGSVITVALTLLTQQNTVRAIASSLFNKKGN